MQLRRGGPWDEVARAEGQRLFDLAQLDLWASLLCALRLPSPKEPTMDRVALKAKVDRENGVYSNFIKASVDVLIYQDEAGYAAVTASLAALEASVKAAFSSKPPQTVAEIVVLYEHAGAIETDFNQVTPCFLLQACF
jgi:hypothetical protein